LLGVSEGGPMVRSMNQRFVTVNETADDDSAWFGNKVRRKGRGVEVRSDPSRFFWLEVINWRIHDSEILHI